MGQHLVWLNLLEQYKAKTNNPHVNALHTTPEDVARELKLDVKVVTAYRDAYLQSFPPDAKHRGKSQLHRHR